MLGYKIWYNISFFSADNIYYTYDGTGHLVSMNLSKKNADNSWSAGVEYYYVRNAQGDIIALIDSTGTQVVSYSYDSWGKLISIKDDVGRDITTDTTSVGYKNPYRYRGYRYDSETGLYYLQSRYYNPEWGRMLNADALGGQVGNLLSHNVFAYCENNPINYCDPSGFIKQTIVDEGGERNSCIDWGYQKPGHLGCEGSIDVKTGVTIIITTILGGGAIAGGVVLGSEIPVTYGIVEIGTAGGAANETVKGMNLQLFANKAQGWIKHDVYNEIRNRFGSVGANKFVTSMNKGIVSCKGENGIKRLSNAVQVGNNLYQYEIKIMGNFGDWRVFGNYDEETGHIIFDMLAKGIH